LNESNGKHRVAIYVYICEALKIVAARYEASMMH